MKVRPTILMNPTHVAKISQELKAAPGQVLATAKLLEEGGTVPFIARYRKEATGSLDEVAITQVRDRMAQLAELDDRRKAILDRLPNGSCSRRELQRRWPARRR